MSRFLNAALTFESLAMLLILISLCVFQVKKKFTLYFKVHWLPHLVDLSKTFFFLFSAKFAHSDKYSLVNFFFLSLTSFTLYKLFLHYLIFPFPFKEVPLISEELPSFSLNRTWLPSISQLQYGLYNRFCISTLKK